MKTFFSRYIYFSPRPWKWRVLAILGLRISSNTDQSVKYRFGKSFWPLCYRGAIVQHKPVKASGFSLFTVHSQCLQMQTDRLGKQAAIPFSRACDYHTNCTSNAFRCGKNCISFCVIVRPIISFKLKRDQQDFLSDQTER